jgi:hypothetical protein
MSNSNAVLRKKRGRPAVGQDPVVANAMRELAQLQRDLGVRAADEPMLGCQAAFGDQPQPRLATCSGSPANTGLSSTSLQTLNVPYSFTTARHSSNSETNATKAGEGR